MTNRLLKRVVITGIGAVTPFGNGIAALMKGLEEGRSAVRRMEGWEEYTGLRSLVGAPVEMRDEKRIPRQKRRSMGRMSIFAAQAAAKRRLPMLALRWSRKIGGAWGALLDRPWAALRVSMMLSRSCFPIKI